MKAQFKADNNYVTLSYDDPFTDERRERTFMVPWAGGYVREGDRQVCLGLSHMGPTLRCGGPDDLLPLIRREYRRMMRADA